MKGKRKCMRMRGGVSGWAKEGNEDEGQCEWVGKGSE